MKKACYIGTLIQFYFIIPPLSLQPNHSEQEIMVLDGTGISYYIETVVMISVRISIILNPANGRIAHAVKFVRQ